MKLPILLLLLFAGGCVSQGGGSLIKDLAVNYAVAKTVETASDPVARIQRVREIALAVRADGSGAPIEKLIREQIQWGALSPVDRQYLHAAISVVADRIELEGVDRVANEILQITDRLAPIYAAGIGD